MPIAHRLPPLSRDPRTVSARSPPLRKFRSPCSCNAGFAQGAARTLGIHNFSRLLIPLPGPSLRGVMVHRNSTRTGIRDHVDGITKAQPGVLPGVRLVGGIGTGIVIVLVNLAGWFFTDCSLHHGGRRGEAAASYIRTGQRAGRIAGQGHTVRGANSRRRASRMENVQVVSCQRNLVSPVRLTPRTGTAR